MQKLTTRTTLLVISFALALAFLPLALFNHFAAATICKVGSILLLLWISVLARPTFPLLTAALACSTNGDLFLEFHELGSLTPATLFLIGLASFLAAHICYIALFAPRTAPAISGLRRLATFGIGIATIVLLTVLLPHVGPMKLPVIIYAVALATMAITAQRSHFSGMVALGAILFVASDSMLAIAHFRGHFHLAGPFIWFSYYAAQVLIALGVLHDPDRSGVSS